MCIEKNYFLRFQGIAHISNTLHCYEWKYLSCVEQATAECDLGNPYEPRQWKSTLQEATDWCLSNEDCRGITRGQFGYEPRRGPESHFKTDAYEAWYCVDTVYNPEYIKF